MLHLLRIQYEKQWRATERESDCPRSLTERRNIIVFCTVCREGRRFRDPRNEIRTSDLKKIYYLTLNKNQTLVHYIQFKKDHLKCLQF